MSTYSDVGEVISMVASLRAAVSEVDVDSLIATGMDKFPEHSSAGYCYATGYLDSVLRVANRELTNLWGTLVALERSLMPAESEVEW